MSPRAIRGGLAFVFAASFVAIVSCEAIVSDQVPQFTCEGTSPQACPDGQYCKGAGCAACEKADVCDHLDNDCNGLVDDGKLCDADSDNFTWCGQLDSQGHPLDVDCDDNDPTVYPGAPEVCDGKDNDCNGKIDEGSICPTQQVCFNGQCVSNPCDPKSSTACLNANQYCDPVSHTCVDKTTVGPGSPCTADAECTPPYFCAKATVVGADVLPNLASGMCTNPCCSSEDCSSNPAMVCYAPGTGGRYCVDPVKLGRGTIGSERAGAGESNASRCRSGVVSNSKCVDTCCNDNNCTNGTSCAYGNFDSHDGFFCQPSSGSGQQWSGCSANSSCHDKACGYYGWFYGGRCVSECCGTSGCGTLDGLASRCYFEKSNVLVPSGNADYIGLCSELQAGTGGLGLGCTSSSDCISGICYTDTSGKYCSDVCCVDSDCGPTFVCRPAPTFPRCVKKL